MDKGAHFYKCDFQVHTPRDINWIGTPAITEEERKEYAKEFVRACREKGINAVAITDHHDIEFYGFIKEASENELDDENNPINNENKLRVFPGMELTLSLPCQAIVIFDPSLSLDLLRNIYSILAISQNGIENENHAEITRLTYDIKGLHDRLNQYDYLENKFIILPNVSEGGNSTLLRSGFHVHYKGMPCVGGYLDGNIQQLGDGNNKILNGKDRNYGTKVLGIFQTSDNRKRDFSDLGNHTSWVKWSQHSAEALRQACLARESRLSQVEPNLPNMYITEINVANSKFLGPFNIELNQQYNAFIGGRGTGKSTILEYLRWGLCDEPHDSEDKDNYPEYQKKRVKLIENTLEPLNSIVKISFVINDIVHIVKRNIENGEIEIKIGDKPFELCDESDVRNLLAIQAYSQKQLSNVGVRIEELRRLIYSPIRNDLNNIKSTISKLASEIKSTYEIKRRKAIIEKDIEKDKFELKSLTEQLNKLKGALKGIKDDDKLIIKQSEIYMEEDQIIESWRREISTAKEAVEEMKVSIKEFPTIIGEEEYPNKKILSDIQKKMISKFSDIEENIELIEKNLSKEGIKEIKDIVDKWKVERSNFNKKYEKAKSRTTSQKSTLEQIKKIEKRIDELRRAISSKLDTIPKKNDPAKKFISLREDWIKIHNERSDIVKKQCDNFSELSDDTLKVTLDKFSYVKKLEELINDIIGGYKVGEKITCYVKKAEKPLEVWQIILDEMEMLAMFDYEDNSKNALPNTPKLSEIGITKKEKERMTVKLNPDNWIDILLSELEDVPIFEYKAREGEYIDFSDASAGQQATALIQVLLNQEGPPLVIDQPEDDLDNEVISDIVEKIWESKKKRQLIFASHNANIVVNGDAELVLCCSYMVDGDQSKGKVKAEGAIDIENIRNEITQVMEGGEKAFKLRKDKYGF